MSGYDAVQTVLAVVSAFSGSSTDSFEWSSDAVSFTQPDGLVDGDFVSSYAATFSVKFTEDHWAWAQFDMHGKYAPEGQPPEMANCHVVCAEYSGWADWLRLRVSFSGMPSAVGTADDPHVQFRCRAELSLHAGVVDPTDSHIDFVLDVDRYGRVECTQYSFEHGQGAVSISPYLQYSYDVEQHGEL
jgi:hypothetical protein